MTVSRTAAPPHCNSLLVTSCK